MAKPQPWPPPARRPVVPWHLPSRAGRGGQHDPAGKERRQCSRGAPGSTCDATLKMGADMWLARVVNGLAATHSETSGTVDPAGHLKTGCVSDRPLRSQIARTEQSMRKTMPAAVTQAGRC